MIEGVPVILPATTRWSRRWSGARNRLRRGACARVLRAEHLVAIGLQTGRAKDCARVAMLREQASLDLNLLADILKRHQLEEKWKLWTE